MADSEPAPAPASTQAPPSRRRRRPLRFALKLFAWVVGVLALLLVLAFAFLQTGPGRDFVKGIALDVLNGTFRGHFSIEELGGTLPFDVELRGVRITDPDGTLVIGAASLRADFDPLALLGQEVRLSHIDVDGADVTVFDAQKRVALARAFEVRALPVPSSEVSPWQVHLEGIRVARATIERLVPDAPADALALAPLDIALTLRIADGGLAWSRLLVTAIPRGESPIARALRSPDAPMGAILIVSDGVLGAAAVNVERLQIQAGPHAVSLAGHVALEGLGSRPDAARLTLDDLHVDVAALGALVPSLAAFSDEVLGSGYVALDAGRALLALEIGSADARVSVEGEGQFLGTDGLFADEVALGDWRLGASFAGRVPVAALAAGWSEALLGTGVAVQVALVGTDSPFASRGQLSGEVHIEELGVGSGGAPGARLYATLLREPTASAGAPPTFIARVATNAFEIARWAALAGQPGLAGMLDALDAQAIVTWAPGVTPTVAGNASFDLTASGGIDLGGQRTPVGVGRSLGAAQFAWDGVGQPTGHVDLRMAAVEVGSVRATSATLTADALDPTADGAWQLRAEADVQGFKAPGKPLGVLDAIARDELSVDALHVVADATRGVRAWLPSANVRVELAGAHRGGDALARGALTLHVRDVSPASFDPDHGRAEVHLEARPAGFRSGSELALAFANLTFDGVVDLAPKAAEPVGAARGSLRGSADGVRLGARRIERVELDLTCATPAALSAPWDVRGKVVADGVAFPEASAATATVDVDVAIDPRSAGFVTRGSVNATMVGLSPAALAGHRFDTAVVTLAVGAQGMIEFATTFEERGRLAGAGHGTVRLPRDGAPLTFDVDDLVVTDLVRGVAVLQWKGASLGKDGWIGLGQIVLQDALAPAGTTPGQLVVGGRIKLAGADGLQLELLVHGEHLDIGRWVTQMHDLTGVAIPDLGLGGVIDIDLAVGGTLAHPRLHATLELADVRFDEHGPFGGSFSISLGESDPGLDVTGYATWGAPGAPQTTTPGKLDVRVRLPVAIGLDPPRVAWRKGSIVDARVSGSNVDIAGALALLRVARPGMPLPALPNGATTLPRNVAGRGAIELTAQGSSDDPEVELRVDVVDLVVGLPAGVVRRGAVDDFTHGTLTLAVHAHGNETTVTLDLARASAQPKSGVPATAPAPVLLHVVAAVPHSLGKLLGDPRPLETLRAQVEGGESSLVVQLPPGTDLSRLPFGDLLPSMLRGARLDALVRLGGRPDAPQVAGHVTLDGFRGFPIETTTRLDITTDGADVHLALVTQTASGQRLIEGDVVVPRLAQLIGDPSHAAQILEDPRFRGEFATADVPSYDLWELSQAIGESAVLFFPDAFVAGMLVVHGAPGGPVADAALRVRTVPSADLLDALQATIPKDALAKASMDLVTGRNFANDARIGLHIGPLRTELRAILLQEGKVGGEHFSVIAAADIGSRVLLDGMPRAFESVGVTGTISAGDFRLEGLASSLRPILGSTRGRVNGEVRIDGTLGKPSLLGSLDLYFEELAIAPVGFKRDEASALVLFNADSTLTVEGLEFAGPDDHGKPTHFALSFKATIPALDAKLIALAARADFQRFRVLDKPDMKGRLDGFVALGGTLARPKVSGKITVLDALIAPKLGDNSVRPIGLPRDVHFVRGEPEVPESRTTARGYRVPLEMDVIVSIPRGELVLRPTLALTLGAEVGANLVPHGELAIRTVASELGIFGTLYVPREEITLYGRSFKVDDDSRVVFTGDIDSDPQLYFAARRSIEDVDLAALGLTTSRDSFVAVRVTGNARAPKVVFSSNPPMDEQNIISIIALGAPASSAPLSQQLSGGVTSVASSLTGSFLAKVTGPLLAKLPIDILTVDSSAGDFSDLRITVGKYITKTLLLRYQYLREFGADTSENVITFEYKLGSIFSIIGKGSDVGSGTIEATFRFHE